MAFFHSPSVVSDGLVLYLDATNSKSYNSDLNLLSPKTYWTEGTGSATQFGRNGLHEENYRISGTDPFGNSAILWECRPSDSTSNSDGGWNSSGVTIDPTYMYRFSVWVKRTVLGQGHFYLGTHGYNSSIQNIGVSYRNNVAAGTTNPYFEVNVSWSQWELENNLNEWYLCVGHVWPVGTTTGTYHPDTGVWDTDGTKISVDPIDFVWREGTTSTVHRCYLYYSTSNDTRQQMVYPRIDKVDGSEPSLQDLLDNNIPPENVTTWKDLSGNGKNGTLTNGARFVNQNRGEIDFDGSNDYIDLGSDVVFKTTGGWTVETWVNYDSVAGAYDNTTSPANFIGAVSIVYNSWYWSVLGSKLALWNRSPGVWKYGSTTLASGRWYHAVLVSYDSGTSYQMYLNGQREGGDHVDYSWNSAYAGLRVRYIGRGNSSNVRQLNGKIASTKIFTRALTDQEVLQNYNATKSRFGL